MYKVSNPNVRDINNDSEYWSDFGSNFRKKDRLNEISNLHAIQEDSELKDKKECKRMDSLSLSSESEKEKTFQSQLKKKPSETLEFDFSLKQTSLEKSSDFNLKNIFPLKPSEMTYDQKNKKYWEDEKNYKSEDQKKKKNIFQKFFKKFL